MNDNSNQVIRDRSIKISGHEKIYRHNNTPLFLAWVTLLGFAVFAWWQWSVWLNIVAIAVILVGGLAVIYLMVAGSVSVSMWLLSWGGREALPVVKETFVVMDSRPTHSLPSQSVKSLPKFVNKHLPAPSLKEITEQLYRGGK